MAGKCQPTGLVQFPFRWLAKVGIMGSWGVQRKPLNASVLAYKVGELNDRPIANWGNLMRLLKIGKTDD